MRLGVLVVCAARRGFFEVFWGFISEGRKGGFQPPTPIHDPDHLVGEGAGFSPTPIRDRSHRRVPVGPKWQFTEKCSVFSCERCLSTMTFLHTGLWLMPYRILRCCWMKQVDVRSLHSVYPSTADHSSPPPPPNSPPFPWELQ